MNLKRNVSTHICPPSEDLFPPPTPLEVARWHESSCALLEAAPTSQTHSRVRPLHCQDGVEASIVSLQQSDIFFPSPFYYAASALLYTPR